MKTFSHLAASLATFALVSLGNAKELQTDDLKEGLILREYARHAKQKDKQSVHLSSEKFGKPVGVVRVLDSVSPFRWDLNRNSVAEGYLHIEKSGAYEFQTDSFYDRNELFLNGEVVCGFSDGTGTIASVQLKKGLVPIRFVGFVETRGSAQVKWRPPGQAELTGIPTGSLKSKKGPWHVVVKASAGKGAGRSSHEVRVVAKDFVVEVYRNGVRISDTERSLLLDRFGATAEKIKVSLRPGDWIVFHVVSNRIRHEGAKYFAAGGIGRHGKMSFVSDQNSPQWSVCDDAARARLFISEREAGTEARAVPIANEWDEGGQYSREFIDENFTGAPIWGASPSTWIKYVVPE